MADTAIVPAYSIVVDDDRSMFGKRSGKKRARLTGKYGGEVHTAFGVSTSDARSMLLSDVVAVAENPRPSYIFCGDGETVLAVYRTLGGWEYEITSAKRTSATGCLMSCETRKQAIQQACSHADQSYSGVLRVIREY